MHKDARATSPSPEGPTIAREAPDVPRQVNPAGADLPGSKDKVTMTHSCAICSVTIERRENEKSYDFLSRKTCSPECMSKLISSHAGRRPGKDSSNWTRLKKPWPKDLWYEDVKSPNG